jgi:hypothetical protein
VTTLRVFSALDLYIVFESHDREAAVHLRGRDVSITLRHPVDGSYSARVGVSG